MCDWDAPSEDSEIVHTSSSPHFNGQHSAAKDWSVLAGGGTISTSQPVKPKWAVPEPENEYVHLPQIVKENTDSALILEVMMLGFYRARAIHMTNMVYSVPFSRMGSEGRGVEDD